MNLFILDTDPDKCAEYHIDKHVTKMQLECAQMMCTNHWIDHILGYVPRALDKNENQTIKDFVKPERAKAMENRLFPYLPCHINHPCTIWMRESLENYYWSFCYAHALSLEQAHRTGGTHKSFEVIRNLPEPTNLVDVGLTTFKLAMKIMPEKWKNEEKPVWSYRNFYMFDKVDFASWKNRSIPYWWDKNTIEEMRRNNK